MSERQPVPLSRYAHEEPEGSPLMPFTEYATLESGEFWRRVVHGVAQGLRPVDGNPDSGGVDSPRSGDEERA